MTEALWTPAPDRVAHTNVKAFMQWLADQKLTDCSSWQELQSWSASNPDTFWQALWDWFEIKASRQPEATVRNLQDNPGAEWFPGARLNYAENILHRLGDGPVLIAHVEGRKRREISAEDFRHQVVALANGLKQAGIQPGDRVAAIVANCPEAIIALLATNAVGAVFSSCSPDFGVKGILERFGQIEPTCLISVDGYQYGGKSFDIAAKTRNIIEQLPSLNNHVIIPFLNEDKPELVSDISRTWEDFCISGDIEAFSFAQLPFDHPLYVLYSSGTTGVPKAIVHGQGGPLLQHMKEQILHADVKKGDRLYFFTTCGWMMWNWLVTGLAAEATVVLYDGSPFYPDAMSQFRMVEAERVTHFGAGAKFYDAVRQSGSVPMRDGDTTSLKAMLSTGSPLSPETFQWMYEHISHDMHVASISGGTDIVSCFVGGDPTSAVYPGEIQSAGLGMDVDVWDDQQQSVRNTKGELVCTRSHPCMPTGFWNDANGERYHEAYFDRFKNIWVHGDFAERTDRGGFIIHGRSDAVLNPGGVRIGTAEIYRVVESLPEIAEAVCVGQDWDNDVRVVLFVRMTSDHRLNEDIIQRIRKQVRTECSPRHVPAKIIEIDDIPRTMSGKIAEIAVRDVIHDRVVKNKAALANPEALDLFQSLEVLQS